MRERAKHEGERAKHEGELSMRESCACEKAKHGRESRVQESRI